MTDFVTALFLTAVAILVMLAPAILMDWFSYNAGLVLFGLYFIMFATWVARWR